MPQSSGSAVSSFVGPDTVSEGNWQGKYGVDGYSIANGSQSLPAYASFAPLNESNWTWSSNTTDPRALQAIPAGRMAATWFSSSTFSLDVNLTDGKSHQVAIYAVDWDDYMGGRAETIQVADANSGAVLDTRNISSFTNGMYLVWNISGHVRINATMNAGGNAVISGIFFGGAMTSAPPAISSFVGLDSVTGSISIGSSATAGTKVIALSGTGAAQVAHSVMLSWTPSTSTVVGYNVYVSTVSGSSYSKLTASPVANAGYTDAGLQTTQTRYYVVTSVDSNNNESAFSNEASVVVP